MFLKNISLVFLALFVLSKTRAEKTCSARSIEGESVVCVCNSTYCDEIVRVAPAAGTYVAYTSSEAGSRFLKITGDIQSGNAGSCSTTLTLDLSTKYQFIEGFGGAVTDAAGINWKNLTDQQLMQNLINSYYSEQGLQYNMIRVPIGGCDFSTHPYAYNEFPENDATLSNYSLTVEDFEYKIPMIKAIKAVSTAEVHIVGTTWAPPTWMKTNGKISGFSQLKSEYFQTYADYHYKFLEKYSKEGISIWAITTTNEPLNGVVPLPSFNSLGWTAETMGKWIVNNLGPTIRNSTFKDVKILGVDDQRYTIALWFDKMISKEPAALNYLDGVAVHWYADSFIPASVFTHITNDYPSKFIISTEACEGSFPWQKDVVLGSWDRAKSYIQDIIEDLNYNLVGWIDWNLCLNAIGGPNWNNNLVDSPIIVFPENGEFVKQPMFYAMGHFSKFVPRGSQRIAVTEKKGLLSSSIDNVAFVTPSNTVVAVLHNGGGARTVCVKIADRTVTLPIEGKSIVTLEMKL